MPSCPGLLDEALFQEIAARLGLSENTVKTRYYRGIERLRLRLQERETPPDERAIGGGL